eukprot:scaffold2919_cov161-Amphora_coffeaeformis.AAC.3
MRRKITSLYTFVVKLRACVRACVRSLSTSHCVSSAALPGPTTIGWRLSASSWCKLLLFRSLHPAASLIIARANTQLRSFISRKILRCSNVPRYWFG